MLSNWIKRLSSRHREKEKELDQASMRVTVSIRRYKNASKEIQSEIENNGFAEFLIYDRGDERGGH